MDFLNRAFAQLGDLFRSMTPAARITSGLLLAVVVVSLVYLFRYQVSGPDDYLMCEPVPQGYLSAMEAAFHKANLTNYTVEGNRIRIPRGQRAAYSAALIEGKALPPNFGSAINKAVEGNGIFDLPAVRKQRDLAAKQEELALMIRAMPGIENANVLYDTDSKPGGFGREKVTTATVGVKPQGSGQLDGERVSSIRLAVAGAFAGMKPENVTVIDLNGRTWSGDSESNGILGENQYAAVKEMHERSLKGKVLNALSFIPNLAVEVSVMLDPIRASESEKTTLEKTPFPLYVEEKGETENREGGGAPGGRPGLDSQVANKATSLATTAAKGPRDEREKNQRVERNSPLSTDRTRKEFAGLTPKSARASVGIPTSYFAKVWRERNPAKEGEDPKKPDQAALDQVRDEIFTSVRKHVAALLPAPEGLADATELVTVTTFQDIKQGEIPAPSPVEKALSWLGQNWGTLGMAGLALVSLMVLRSMVRTPPVPAEPNPMALRIAPESEEPAAGSSETPEAKAARRLRRMTSGGPSLRDELSDLVKEDPDAAANILRTWIGSAG